MNDTKTGALPGRSIALLAAALFATFATALGTIGGLAHWNAAAAPASTPTPVVQQAPIQHWTEEAD